MIWHVTATRDKLSDILDRASEEGPQIVTYREKRYVILEEAEFEERSVPAEKKDFVDFLLNGPRFDGVEIERDKSPILTWRSRVSPTGGSQHDR